ncbi:MAG: stage V sporulation protein AE [Clostridia bacterium]|nr:stage V sporulation protein AE [Clostridia bacterium]
MIYLYAFLVGGAFCLVGQVLIDRTRLTPARILVGFVVAGVILGATGVYKYIADFAGCGASVPLTGFGNALVEGTRQAVEEQGLLGAFTGPLTAGSAGILAAVMSGLAVSFLTKPRAK